MVQDSPAQALGADAAGARDVLVEVVRSVHERFAEAHQVSGSRYAMGFGSQWRDLLDDAHEAFASRGFRSQKLAPAGYRLPVVGSCLIYVWRGNADTASNFASSPTRQSGFGAVPLPQAMLIEPSFADWGESIDESGETSVPNPQTVLRQVDDPMTLVLVIVDSSPRQLQSIQWAIAVLDEAGKVQLYGQESIWEPELAVVGQASEVESFDSGTPVAPVVELQKQEGPHSDA
ncbi:hypothetical protein [Raineyella antarctica]|uniref:hypothetical protein n=1 Tax=Raineyella antarctica TaxID=1577474 RepID=UPI000B891E58|nr:hypothetical protein [Raineyella antarctica]